MFNFLTQKSDGTLVEITAADLIKLSASKYAWNRCANIIADAVAKSEVLVYHGTNTSNDDELYYKLNISPNPNETGTEFWKLVTRQLLNTQEAMIIPMNGMFYRATSWQTSDLVIKAQKYTDIMIESGGKSMQLRSTYKADEVVHIRIHNEEITNCWTSLMKQYDVLIDSATAMASMSYTPKFALRINAPGSINFVDTTSGKPLTKKDFADRMLGILKNDQASMLTLSDGVDISQIEIKNPVSAADIVSITDSIDRRTTIAFGIPITVYDGTITEKSDATNELMTYAVMPIVEAINDALNASLVGYDSYKKGQRINVWTGNFAHRDVIDCAEALDKLRSNGWSFDECRKMVGYPELNTEFSQARLVTKNYSENGGDTNGKTN